MLTHRRDVAAAPGFAVVRPVVDRTIRLPPEILGQIFSFFRPREFSNLACVCRRWSQTIRQTPRLWTSLDAEDQTVSERYLKMVLENSKDTRLSICMTVPQPAAELGGVQRQHSVYLSILGAHLGRIERLQLQLAAREDAQALLELLRDGGGSLRVLRLLPLGQPEGHELVLPRNLLAGNPGVLEDLTFAWNMQSATVMPAAFRNVTHFQWFSERVTKATLAAVFQTCVSLVSLEVKAQEYSSAPSTPPLVHRLQEVVVYQPVKYALLEDLRHDSIPVVGISTDRKQVNYEMHWAEERSDDMYSSWSSASALRFDALSIGWETGSIPVLNVQYTAGSVRRFAHISYIFAMDVLNGHGLDFEHLTSLTIEDGCWPERLPLSATLSTLTIVVPRPPADVAATPFSTGRWTIFGHGCTSAARLNHPHFPALRTLCLTKSCASEIVLSTARLLAFVELPHAYRPLNKLHLAKGVSLHGTGSDSIALQERFTHIVA